MVPPRWFANRADPAATSSSCHGRHGDPGCIGRASSATQALRAAVLPVFIRHLLAPHALRIIATPAHPLRGFRATRHAHTLHCFTGMATANAHSPPSSHATLSTARVAIEAAFHDEGHGYDVFGLHPPTLGRMLALGAPLYDRYFRVSSEGIAHVPSHGPTILVANHAGALPVDAAMLCFDVLRRTEPPRIPRAIADHFVPRVPVVGTWLSRCGVVPGTRRNVARLLERGELIAIWPEGTTGPAKRFRDRYRLQAWRVGFAELAIRYQAQIVPVSILGAEESWPLAARLGVRWYGAPYLPIPAWPVPLPVHYRIEYGAAIDLRCLAEQADDPAIVAAAAARVHAVLSRQLDDMRFARRGIFR